MHRTDVSHQPQQNETKAKLVKFILSLSHVTQELLQKLPNTRAKRTNEPSFPYFNLSPLPLCLIRPGLCLSFRHFASSIFQRKVYVHLILAVNIRAHSKRFKIQCPFIFPISLSRPHFSTRFSGTLARFLFFSCLNRSFSKCVCLHVSTFYVTKLRLQAANTHTHALANWSKCFDARTTVRSYFFCSLLHWQTHFGFIHFALFISIAFFGL